MPRPNYSTAKENLQRPSTVQETKRSSAPHRLRRLRGLINLYHWSLEWAIHADSDWTLGESAYPFRLDRGDLWLLGIDQVADLLNTNWGETAISAGAEKRDDSTLRGHFNPRELASNEDMMENAETLAADNVERRFTVKAHSWTHSGPSLTFEGRDLLTSVLFFSPGLKKDTSFDSWATIPFDVISPALRQASNHVAKDLADLGIAWNRPPFYRHFENGGQLLKYIKAKQIDGESELADLEQHRCEFCEIIDGALGVADLVGAETDLVTIAEMACLADLAQKTIRHLLTGASLEPVHKASGASPARYSYAAFRDVIVQKRPKYASCLPESFADAVPRLAKLR